MDLTPEETKAQSGFGSPITMDYEDNVAIITMRRGDNRFNMDLLDQMHKALDDVERYRDNF